MLKNLAFTISKTNFIIYNTSFYNIASIKTSIFLTFYLKIISLLFFIHFFILLSLSLSPLSLCFSTQLFSAPPAPTSIHPYPNHHIHPPSPPLATSNRTKSPQPQQEKKEKTHNPQPKKTHKPNQQNRTTTPSIHASTRAPWLTTKICLNINTIKPRLITLFIVIQQSLTISIVIQQRNNKKKQNPE